MHRDRETGTGMVCGCVLLLSAGEDKSMNGHGLIASYSGTTALKKMWLPSLIGQAYAIDGLRWINQNELVTWINEKDSITCHP